MRKTFIYCLVNNRTPFYVGRTADICQRGLSHKKNFGDCDIYILKEIFENEHFWEKFYIDLFLKMGFKLKNKNLYIKKIKEKKIRVIPKKYIRMPRDPTFLFNII